MAVCFKVTGYKLQDSGHKTRVKVQRTRFKLKELKQEATGTNGRIYISFNLLEVLNIINLRYL